MRKIASFSILAAIIAAPVFAQSAPQKRVAVLNFDYATVQGGLAAIFGTNQDIGKGIADILVDRLVNDHVFTVYERKAMDKLLAEQNFSNSDRADPTTAAKLGRMLGVDAIIIGSITQFGRDDKKTSIGGGGYGLGKYGLGGIGHRESKAVVQISARLVAVETGQILATSQGLGESQRSGTGLLGAGGGPIGGGGGGVDMQSSNFAATILGEATNKAVTQLARGLESNAGIMPTHTVKLNGLVADASGGTLVLNIGSKAGVKVGDTLEVTRPIREIRDPATGKVIRKIEDKIGQVVITDVDDTSSVGKFTGSGAAKVGDAVKN